MTLVPAELREQHVFGGRNPNQGERVVSLEFKGLRSREGLRLLARRSDAEDVHLGELNFVDEVEASLRPH